MGQLLDIVNPLHKKTDRDYIGRMINDKVQCMEVAKQYDRDFWDGDRKYGYGGYRYDGRWSVVARGLIDYYGLSDDCRILDVGCGKGFLLYEFKRLLPNAEIAGFDASRYAVNESKDEIRDCLFVHRAEEKYPYADNEFDLVVSLTTLHNLLAFDLKAALTEIQRVGKQKYLVVESFRNNRELFNLQCWALTCATFITPEEWVWFFDQYGYDGDYEFIYFE